MLIPYETRKLYYAYPTFIVAYHDVVNGYNITTGSSSYSLGDMFVFGFSSDSNAAKQLAISPRCTINYMGIGELDQLEYAGYLHRREKLISGHIPHYIDNKTNLPVLTDAISTLFVTIIKTVPYTGYMNYICKIDQRLVQSNLIHQDKLDPSGIAPVLYVGDQHKRIYRECNDSIRTTGKYFRTRNQ